MSEQGSQVIYGAGIVHPQFLEQLIYAAVGPVLGGRCYPGVAPSDVKAPYAVHAIVSDVPDNTLADGAAVRALLVQFDLYSLSRGEGRTLAEGIKTAVDSMVSPTLGATLQRGQTLYDPETRLHRIILEFNFILPRNSGTS